MRRRWVILFLLGLLFAVLPTSTAGAGPASLPSLAGCFGHHGTQLSTHIAFECIDQSVSGGALYWSANESNFNWDKHPDVGLLWVEASTLHPALDANPPNSFQAFWVGIPVTVGPFHRIMPTVLTAQTTSADFCNVVDPGVGQSPTMCAVDGNVQVMPTQVQDSYDAFAAAMQSANLPWCAWSYQPVTNEDACDIDS